VSELEEAALGFWDTWFTKQNELSTTVPLNMGAGIASYPDANYSNFASEGYAKNEIVHACIRELSISAATPKYHITAPSNDGGIVEVESGLLFDLITNPNPHSDWYSFIERLVTFLMVAGNAYALKERGRNDQVNALYLLRPDRVAIVPGDYGAQSYVYTVGGVEYGIEARDMCHLALPNPGGDIYGLSPLQVLSRTVNLDLNMTDFAKVYFQNAGVPSGLLKIKRRLTSQEEASTIRARWRSQFGGANNFHRIAVLDDDAEYQPMSNSPKDMALEGLHNLTESRICAVFGVPPILVGANVGLQRSTYSNYREARLAFHSETLEPLVARILRYFNRNLFAEYGGNETLTVDWSAMRAVLDDAAAASTRITALFAGGLVTLNEAREELGFQAVSDGGVRRIPSSIFEVAEGESATVAVEAAPVEVAPVEAALSEPVAIKAPRMAPRGRMLQRRILEEREEETDALAKKLRQHFKGIRNRVDGILGRYMERQTGESKDFPFTVEDMLPPIETGNLSDILRAAQTRASKRTFKTILDIGIAGALDWSEKLPVVQRILNTAPARAQMIHRTSSKAIGRGVKVALERGYSVEQLARGVPDDNFPGLRSILTETDNRARMIARTETMRTQNQSSIGYYQTQGYMYVQADDVDGDADDTYVDPGDPFGRTCAERHGQIYQLEDAHNIDDHPNGTLNWMPMPRGYKPEESL
jgi:HK97 family phage portal protein